MCDQHDCEYRAALEAIDGTDFSTFPTISIGVMSEVKVLDAQKVIAYLAGIVNPVLHERDTYGNPVTDATQSLCIFREPYYGVCKDTTDGGLFCAAHEGVRCVDCGKQATYRCTQSMGCYPCNSAHCSNDLCTEHIGNLVSLEYVA